MIKNNNRHIEKLSFIFGGEDWGRTRNWHSIHSFVMYSIHRSDLPAVGSGSGSGSVQGSDVLRLGDGNLWSVLDLAVNDGHWSTPVSPRGNDGTDKDTTGVVPDSFSGLDGEVVGLGSGDFGGVLDVAVDDDGCTPVAPSGSVGKGRPDGDSQSVPQLGLFDDGEVLGLGESDLRGVQRHDGGGGRGDKGAEGQLKVSKGFNIDSANTGC